MALGGGARALEPVDYDRYSLPGLIFGADVVVSGEIVALHDVPAVEGERFWENDSSFELAVEHWVVGAGPERIWVGQFQDWTCAGREVPYEVGQGVLLFASAPEQPGKPYQILGAGGEGELFLAGDDVLVRGFRIHGYPSQEADFGSGEVHAARIDQAEWFAAVRGFREAFVWPGTERDNREWMPELLAYREGPEAAQAYAATSTSARHLFERALDFPGLRPKRTPAARRLVGLPNLALELPVGSTVAAGRTPVLVELGDLDGDGLAELALSAPSVFHSGYHMGGMWILFPDASGGIARTRELDIAGLGGGGIFSADSRFGDSLASVGDLDGDGVPDLAVGAPGMSTSSEGSGAVWILFLDRSGGVERIRELTASEAFRAVTAEAREVRHGPKFGRGLARLGDLDGDGRPELVVSRDLRWSTFRDLDRDVVVSLDGQGGVRWARYLERDGRLGCLEGFSKQLVGIGDVDGDGVPDMAIGDPGQEDADAGGVWIAFMGADGSIRSETLISAWSGGLEATLFSGDELGQALAGPGDVNGDGTPDLLVVSNECIWLFELRADGSVEHGEKLLGLEPHGYFRVAIGASFPASWLTIAGDSPGSLRRVELPLE